MRRLFNNVSSVILSASLATTVVSGLSIKTSNNKSHHHNISISSRRNWIGKLVSSTTSLCITNNNNPALAQEIQELPINLRKYTALAPLGGDASTSTTGGNKKLTGLSMERIASRLSHDLVEGSTGKGGYFISGKPYWYSNIMCTKKLFISVSFRFRFLIVSCKTNTHSHLKNIKVTYPPKSFETIVNSQIQPTPSPPWPNIKRHSQFYSIQNNPSWNLSSQHWKLMKWNVKSLVGFVVEVCWNFLGVQGYPRMRVQLYGKWMRMDWLKVRYSHGVFRHHKLSEKHLLFRFSRFTLYKFTFFLMQQLVMYVDEYDLHTQDIHDWNTLIVSKVNEYMICTRDAHYSNTLVVSKSLDSIHYLHHITNSFGSH